MIAMREHLASDDTAAPMRFACLFIQMVRSAGPCHFCSALFISLAIRFLNSCRAPHVSCISDCAQSVQCGAGYLKVDLTSGYLLFSMHVFSWLRALDSNCTAMCFVQSAQRFANRAPPWLCMSRFFILGWQCRPIGARLLLWARITL